jgi:hypothetical protein
MYIHNKIHTGKTTQHTPSKPSGPLGPFSPLRPVSPGAPLGPVGPGMPGGPARAMMHAASEFCTCLDAHTTQAARYSVQNRSAYPQVRQGRGSPWGPSLREDPSVQLGCRCRRGLHTGEKETGVLLPNSLPCTDVQIKELLHLWCDEEHRMCGCDDESCWSSLWPFSMESSFSSSVPTAFISSESSLTVASMFETRMQGQPPHGPKKTSYGNDHEYNTIYARFKTAP